MNLHNVQTPPDGVLNSIQPAKKGLVLAKRTEGLNMKLLISAAPPDGGALYLAREREGSLKGKF